MAISSPAWFSRFEACLAANASERSSAWVQLASVRADGRPAVRTLVFRGVERGPSPSCSPLLSFATDARSDKVGQLRSREAVQACWYLAATREQWRVGGRAVVVTAGGGADGLGAGASALPGGWTAEALQETRMAAWARLSDTARAMFSWPQPGGAREEADAAFPTQLPPAAAESAFANFALILLSPDEADCLSLRYEPTQRRSRFVQGENGEWAEVEANP